MTDYAERRTDVAARLDKMSADVTKELKDAGLSMPIFLIVPSTGKAFVTFGTPDDPSDDDWNAVSKIVTDVVAGYLGSGIKLMTNELRCAAAGLPKAGDGRVSTAI